ncbi:hypothetical protein H5410_003069 [Solanum commersonii]|uniref:Uncharacterized protein n=1 Tax=Solanum commersonii TaxID=4109 RepID=A0A9J6B412_SOLCO|nr:hypothetical protein H5410_003069 [Solanum commersonii]
MKKEAHKAEKSEGCVHNIPVQAMEDFLRAKYCQRSNPICKKWDTSESLTWRHLMHNKRRIEEHTHWKINSGTYSFWWDN